MSDHFTPRIKVCGLRDPENIAEIIDLKPDYIGLIFYPKSARFIGGKLPVHVAREIDLSKKVGVFVDGEYDEITDAIDQYELDVIQLHGNESPEFVAKVRNYGIDVIKAFSVSEDFDFSQLEPYKKHVDFFLFDTKGENPGGNGTTFDWSILEAYDGSVPFFLSGGISPEHAETLKTLELPGLYGLDLNSKFESKPGIKDWDLLEEFIDVIRPEGYWD